MSEKIKPSFEVNGKTYELYFSKSLRLEYQKRSDEKKNDSQYQMEVAEYQRLQDQLETIQEKYKQAETEYLDNITNEDKEKVYNKFCELYERKHKELAEYATEHKSVINADKFTVDLLEQIVLLGLQEQHKLSSEEAEQVWCSYVDEKGYIESLEFLARLGTLWLVGIDEDTNDPFLSAMRKKAEQAEKRRAGLSKIKK